MHSVVSVRNPTGVAISVPQQVRCDLGHATLPGVEVERESRELVDDRDGARVLAQVDREQVAMTALAGVHAHVPEVLALLVDRQTLSLLLAAASAGHAA